MLSISIKKHPGCFAVDHSRNNLAWRGSCRQCRILRDLISEQWRANLLSFTPFSFYFFTESRIFNKSLPHVWICGHRFRSITVLATIFFHPRACIRGMDHFISVSARHYIYTGAAAWERAKARIQRMLWPFWSAYVNIKLCHLFSVEARSCNEWCHGREGSKPRSPMLFLTENYSQRVDLKEDGLLRRYHRNHVRRPTCHGHGLKGKGSEEKQIIKNE